MSTIRTIYEIVTRGGAESEQQLRQVGKVGAEAFAKIDAAAAVVPKSLRAVDAAASTVKGSIDQLAAKAGPLGAAFSAIGGPIGLLGVATAGAGIGLLALTKHAFDAASALVDTADATGVSVEALQKYHIAAATAGVSAGEFDDAIQTLNKTVGQAQVGTGRLSKFLGTLDADLLKNLTSATTSGDRFEVLAQKLAHTESATQRVAIATAAGGASMAKLLPLLKDGENGFTAIGQSAEAAGAIMSDKAARAADEAGDKFTALGLILEGQVNAAFIASAPLINNIAQAALDAIPSVLAFVNSFLPATSIEARLAEVRKQIFKTQDELMAAEGGRLDATHSAGAPRQQGSFLDRLLGTDHAAEVGAKLDDLIEQERKLEAESVKQDADAKQRSANRLAQLKAEIAQAREALGGKKEHAAADAAAAKAASAAAAATKQRLDAEKKFVDDTRALHDENNVAQLDAISAIDEAEAQAFAHVTELLEQQVINEAEAADREVEIRRASEIKKSDIRQKEADKQAEIVAKAAEKEAKALEKRQEELRKPFDNAIENIQRDFGDMFTSIIEDGEFSFETLADSVRHIFARLAGELAELMVIRPVLAAVTGAGGQGGIFGGGGGGEGIGSLLQTGQQILSFGKTLYGGFEGLTSALFGATTATTALSGEIGSLGLAAASQGIVAGSSGAALFGIENAGTIAASGLVGVAPGTGPLLVDASGAVISAGSGAVGGIGAGLAATGIGAAVAAAVIGILATIQTAIAGSKARDTFFDQGDALNFAKNAILDGGIVEGIAQITTRLMSFGAVGAEQGGSGLDKVLSGRGASGKDWFSAIALMLANPLAPIVFLASKPGTKGTALRKQFEEFIENDELGAGFFTRDSGTFIRGIGQTGKFDGKNRAPLDVQTTIGGGTRGIIKETGLDFVPAMREFIDRQKESIGLSDKQLQQFIGLGVAFRGLVGDKAGKEEQRSLSIVADLLGSITVEGAGAAESMAIVQQAIAGLGRPETVFETLNAFFTSGKNDIAVEDYRNAIQGLSAALFNDLPQGVDASAVALRLLNETATVTFEQLEKQILGAVAEAEALGPALQEAFKAGINDKDLDLTAFGDAVFDAVSIGLQEAIAQASFDSFISDAFKGDILGPFLETFNETTTKVKAGELTGEEGTAILVAAAKDARDSLETLRPMIEAAVAAGRDLASVFEDLSAGADDAAEAAKKLAKDVFETSIKRGILGQLSPNLAAQFDLEVQQRDRLFAAREAGADLVDVEKLNGLERAALLESQASDTAQQIERIYAQAKQAAERAIAGVKALVTQLTATTASPLPPEEALANAQAQFAKLAGKARGGDLAAIEALPEAGQAVIDLARELFGSTDKFFALFNPTLATLTDIAGLNPSAVKLTAGDQAIVDAIHTESAEALKLYQQMLDALLLSAEGKPVADTGTLAGDQISKGVPGPTQGGQFGLGSAEQQVIQRTLAGLTPGGATEQEILHLLTDARTFADVQAIGEGTGLAADLVDAILGSFPGVRSLQGFRSVLEAFRGKITNPSAYSSVLGFDTGGSFRVRDSIPLMPGVRVSPGETVTVTTHGMDEKLGVMVQQQSEVVAELRALRREYAVVSAELQQIRATYQHQAQRPAVPL